MGNDQRFRLSLPHTPDGEGLTDAEARELTLAFDGLPLPTRITTQTFLPVLYQNGVAVAISTAAGATIVEGQFADGWVDLNVRVLANAVGTAGGRVDLSVPSFLQIDAAVVDLHPIGNFYVRSNATAAGHSGPATPTGAGIVGGTNNGSTNFLGVAGSSFTAALAVSDIIGYSIRYRAVGL